MRIRHAILTFGVLNAFLYSGLLPLWEGFDEAFHYAYVETLWQTRQFPVLGRALVPIDVFRSFEAAPVSYIVHRHTPQAISFDNWFPLTQADKEQRRRELDLLRPLPENSTRPNYEAHQPPLAYIILAFADRWISNAPITMRVLVLRMLCALLSVVLTYFGTRSLCRALELPEWATDAALLTIFCSQMFYATTAHVANDWLAVGLSALFLGSLAWFVRKPDSGTALRAALWLAAGLLTKAYFLVFALLALAVSGVMIWRRRARLKTVLGGGAVILILAGPWYARNLHLYGNVSGTHEEFDGIGVRQALAAAPRIDWISTSGFLARGSLWTGNNSFTTFSRRTLNIALVLLFAALVTWKLCTKAIPPAEWSVVSAIVLFSAAVGYASCASFADKGADIAGASPWYTQTLLVPVIVLAYLGMSRWKFGGILAGCTVTIWAWTLIATWIVKLFPLYSGWGAAPLRFHDVWDRYVQNPAGPVRELSALSLAPGYWLYGGLLLSLVLCVVLSGIVIRRTAALAQR